MKKQLLIILTSVSLQLHEKYNEIMKLLRNSKDINHLQMRTYNQMGATPQSLKVITYDLQQIFKITDKELRETHVAENQTDVLKLETAVLSKEMAEDLAAFAPENYADYHKQLKPFAAALANELDEELESMKKADLLNYILTKQEQFAQPVFVNPFTEASADAKAGLKLRVEFPFLADTDCPDKFKILVADKLTAFQAVLANREELFKQADGQTLSDAEMLELVAGAVENFELNAEIYAELNHYQEQGEILGKHPIFAEEVLQREINEMDTNKAHQELRNLATYISKEKKKLESAKTDVTKEKIQAVIDGHETRRTLIAEKLGLDEK